MVSLEEEPLEEGQVNWFNRLFCYLFRHDFVKVFYQDNGRSQFREYECVRCGKVTDYQYDYN